MKSKVYFTRDITPENVVRLYHLLDVELPGKRAPRPSPRPWPMRR